jgi:hypothetical protein
MVKPIPVKHAPAAMKRQLRPGALVAMPVCAASQPKAKTPMGLPKTNPEFQLALDKSRRQRQPNLDVAPNEALSPELSGHKHS